MKSIFYLTAIYCFLNGLLSCSPKTAVVTYHIDTAKPLLPNQTVYITGNQQTLGEWQPNKIAFSRKNDSLFVAKIKLPIKQKIAYKFTRGSWEQEELDKKGQVPPNQILIIRKDTLITHRIENWKEQNSIKKGQVAGTLKHFNAWKGNGIEPRNVHIWLPSNYDSTGKTRYAVMYCHDGQNVFDAQTASFGTEWQLDETADSLIENGVCRPFLIVAMDCTKNRTAEYSYQETGENYQKWVVNTLKPYIDAHFPTLPDAENTATLGSSMGGLCAFELAWNYPTVFGYAACFSPAFRVKKTDNSAIYELDYLSFAQKSTIFKPINLYIDNGTIDLEARLQPGIDDMMQFLRERKQPFTWYLANGESHNEAAWAKRAWRPLVQFFKK